MQSFSESLVKGAGSLPDRGSGINVERRAETLGQKIQGNLVAAQGCRSAFFLRMVRKRRGTSLKGSCRSAHSVVLAPSLTLITTTVWSSKVSMPAEYSVTAVNSVSTSFFAVSVAHRVTIS